MKLRSIGLTILLVAGLFFAAALVMNFIVMPLFVHQKTSVLVPDVRGMSQQQAVEFLDRVSLVCEVERRQNNPDVPEGFVISQRPRPNDTIREGRTVTITLSLGPKTQRVPELKELSLRQGRLLLARQKLETGRVARVLFEGPAREIVLACSPGVGREVPEGSEVDLLVGVGGRPRRFLMPDLTGQDLLFIREKLENAGFRVSNVRYESKHDAYPNTIIDQDPKPGLMIREGDSIELVAAGS
jgi:beta-lactam-binding protein with PASTA domain